MKRETKEQIKDIGCAIANIAIILMTIGLLAMAVLMAVCRCNAILEGDMPEWLKWILLAGEV